MGAMAVLIGLGGQDLALDRTAAIRWAPRRAAHVLLCGAVVGAALLTMRATGESMAATAFVVRDSAGLMGLVALGSALLGGQCAWTLPFAWLSFSFFLRPAPDERADAGGDLDAAAARHGSGRLDGPGPHGRRHRGLRRRGTETVTAASGRFRQVPVAAHMLIMWPASPCTASLTASLRVGCACTLRATSCTVRSHC